MLNSCSQAVYLMCFKLVKGGLFYTRQFFVKQPCVKTRALFSIYPSFLRNLYTYLLFVITPLDTSFYPHSTGLITKATNYLIN